MREPMIVHEWQAPAGSPARVGEDYGRRWGDQLAGTHAEYAQHFAVLGIAPEVLAEVSDGCRAATEEHAPEIAEELHGMARGSGLTVRQVMSLAARTEILARRPGPGECSAIVHVPADGSAPRTLQTWDWRVAMPQEALVRRHRAAGGAAVVTFCEFGQPAKIGVNDRGLGAHFNILHHASDGEGPGVPVHVLVRMVLDRAETVAEAAAIVSGVPRCASSVFTLAAHGPDGPEAGALEISPAGVAVVGVERGGTLSHTNHFLDAGLGAGERAEERETTWARLACLEDAAGLAAIEEPRARAEAFGAIPRAPISVRPDPGAAPHEQVETKLTAALDVERARLEFALGAPADITTDAWRVVSA